MLDDSFLRDHLFTQFNVSSQLELQHYLASLAQQQHHIPIS